MKTTLRCPSPADSCPRVSVLLFPQSSRSLRHPGRQWLLGLLSRQVRCAGGSGYGARVCGLSVGAVEQPIRTDRSAVL